MKKKIEKKNKTKKPVLVKVQKEVKQKKVKKVFDFKELSDGYSFLTPAFDDLIVCVGFAIAKKKDKFGVVSNESKIIIPVEFKEIQYLGENCFAVKKDDKFGIYVADKLVIESQFDTIQKFIDGMAIFTLDGKYGAINTLGEIVVESKYKTIYQFKDGAAHILGENGKIGVIDKTGKVLFEPVFDRVTSFTNGFAIITKDDKLGIITNKGEMIAEPIYDRIEGFDVTKGFARVKKGELFGALCGRIITKQG